MSHHVDDTLAQASKDIIKRLNIQPLPCTMPDTFDAIVAFYGEHGAIAVNSVWTPDRWMGDLETAQAFEAWHDWSHIESGGQFDMEGEQRVNALQQAHLADWWGSNRHVSLDAIRRASATLDHHNIGRLVHWDQWGGPPEHAKSFAQGYLAALNMAKKPKVVHYNVHSNEWTDYTG